MSSLSFPTEFMNSKRPIFDSELMQNHLGPEGQDSPREYSLKTNVNRQQPKPKIFKQNFLKIAKHVNKFTKTLVKGTEISRFSELSRNLFEIIDDKTSSYDYYVESGLIKGKLSFAYQVAQIFKWCFRSNKIQIPILMPDQFIVVLINFLVLITLFIQIIYLPILIAFNSELETSTLNILDSYVVYVYILELIVNLNTAYYSKGQIQGNRQSILLQNLKEGLVFNIFVVVCSFGDNQIQVFRIIRLLKIYQIMSLVEQFEEMYFLRQRFSSLLDILRLLFLLVVIAHICSCAWYFLTKNEQGWLVKIGIEDSSVRVKYINSLYWVSITFLTVGYGDITPITTNEKLIGTVLAYFTCGLFGYAINKIGTIISDQNSKEQYFKEQMALINSFMNKRKISQNLQLKIRNYYLYFLKSEERKKQVEKIDKALSQLDPQIKTHLNQELYFKILQKCQYFNQLSQETLLEIVTCIQEELFSPNQVILESQKISQKLYFVLDNRAQLNIKDKKIQQQTDQFFLNEEEFFCQKPTLFSISSAYFIKVASLNYEQLINIIKKNKTDNEKFRFLLDNQCFYQEKKYCQLCKDEHHDSLQCKQVFYIPNRLRLLNKYNQSIEQMRKSKFYREKQKSLNSKQNSMSNKAEAINFCLENELLSHQDIDIKFLHQVGLEQENTPLAGRYTLTQIKNAENRMSVLLIKQDQDQSDESSNESEKDQMDKISQRIQKHRQSKFQGRQTLVNFKLDPIVSGDTAKYFSRPSLQSSIKKDSQYQGSEKEREKEFTYFDRAQNYQIYYPKFNLSRILDLFQIIYQAKMDEAKHKHPLLMMKNKWISNRTMMKKS